VTTVRTRTVLAALAASTAALTACGTNDSRGPLQPADTVATTSSTPSITYESNGPGPDAWLAITVNIPSTVTVGDTIAITGTCDPAAVGGPAGVGIYLTATANPPAAQWGGGSGWTGVSTAYVQPDGSFTQTLLASVPPGTYYFQPSCAEESWMDDALYSDGNGGTIIRYYEYPDSQLRAVTVVAAASVTTTTDGTAGTLPPTR